jgi:hypothetical protein
LGRADLDCVMTLPPRRKPFSLWLSMLGMASLCYLAGAAAMFFDLPTSGFLEKAFSGAQAWREQDPAASRGGIDQPPTTSTAGSNQGGTAFDGFTLYTCAKSTPLGTQAFLIDMQGNVVHRWMVAFGKVWPDPPHIHGRVPDNRVCFFGCRLDANGDLLVVFLGADQTGCGLAKLDRDSNVVWKYAAPVHHDVDVAEDGTIYALLEETIEKMPEGLERIPTPALADYVVALSPDGTPLGPPISMLEALRDSPYADLLSTLEPPESPMTAGFAATHGMNTRQDPHLPPGSTLAKGAIPKGPVPGARARELLHANAVKVLPSELAADFPGFEAGQVLVSMRDIHAVALLDVAKRSVVWAACGPWRSQHDPSFLAGGRLLIFDNHGLEGRSRVFEYDPRTQALPWSFSGRGDTRFYTNEGGMCQRLPNGNTLIVSSEDGKIFEVTPDKSLAWSTSIHRIVTSARRYGRDQLPFLEGGQDARP